MKETYTDRFGYLVTVEDGFETYTDERGIYTLKNYHGKNLVVSVPDGIQYIFIDAFSNSQIEKVILPDSVLEIGTRSFQYCSNLREFIFPKSIQCIGEAAFNNCNSLHRIEFSGSPRYIGRYCFSGTMIETAIIPKGILNTLGPIYTDCKHLKEAIIEEKGMVMNTGEFSKCDNLETVYFDGPLSNLPPLIRYRIEKNKGVVIRALSEREHKEINL